MSHWERRLQFSSAIYYPPICKCSLFQKKKSHLFLNFLPTCQSFVSKFLQIWNNYRFIGRCKQIRVTSFLQWWHLTESYRKISEPGHWPWHITANYVAGLISIHHFITCTHLCAWMSVYFCALKSRVWICVSTATAKESHCALIMEGLSLPPLCMDTHSLFMPPCLLVTTKLFSDSTVFSFWEYSLWRWNFCHEA